MAEEEKKKQKKPTALKRDIRNSKRRLLNKAFKSQVRTAIRAFEEAEKAKNLDLAKQNLNSVYSLMDKGVKRGVYKKNKAARLKANFSQKLVTISK